MFYVQYEFHINLIRFIDQLNIIYFHDIIPICRMLKISIFFVDWCNLQLIQFLNGCISLYCSTKYSAYLEELYHSSVVVENHSPVVPCRSRRSSLQHRHPTVTNATDLIPDAQSTETLGQVRLGLVWFGCFIVVKKQT